LTNTEVSANSHQITIDTTAPEIASVSVVDDPVDKFLVGDTLSVTLSAANDESGLQLGDGFFNGQSVDDFTDEGGGTYKVKYTIKQGDPSVGDGQSVATDLSLKDAAGNESQSFTSVTLNGESLSGKPPLDVQVSSVDSDTAKFTVFANEDYAETPGELGAFDVEFSFDAGKLTFNSGSAASPSGFTIQPNERQIDAGVYSLSGFNLKQDGTESHNFQDELFNFEMDVIDNNQNSTLSFQNVIFENSPIIDSTFDFDPATFSS